MITILTNDIKKGTKVIMKDGYQCTIMDNAKGNIRSVKGASLFGQGEEWGSVYSYDIRYAFVLDDNGNEVMAKVTLTEKQIKARQMTRSIFG